MNKQEKLIKLLTKMKDTDLTVMECFASSKQYGSANKYQVEARTYEDVIRLVTDEEYFNRIYNIFFKEEK